MENNELLQAIRQIVKEEVDPVRQDVSGLKQEITKINITLENDIGQKLSALFDAHKLDSEKIDHISETVDSMNDAYAATDMIARMNTAQINKLKSKIG